MINKTMLFFCNSFMYQSNQQIRNVEMKKQKQFTNENNIMIDLNKRWKSKLWQILKILFDKCGIQNRKNYGQPPFFRLIVEKLTGTCMFWEYLVATCMFFVCV